MNYKKVAEVLFVECEKHDNCFSCSLEVDCNYFMCGKQPPCHMGVERVSEAVKDKVEELLEKLK